MLIARMSFSLAPLRQQQAVRALRLYLLLAFMLLNVLSQESLVVVRGRQRFELHRLLGATRAWLLRTYAMRSLVRGGLVFAGSLLLGITGWWILQRVLPAVRPWNRLRFGMVLSELAWILPVAVTLVMGAAPVIVLELAVLFVLITVNLAKAVYGSVRAAVGQPLPMTSALAGRLPFVVRGVVANVYFHGRGQRPGFYFFQDQRPQSISPSSTTLVVAPALSAAKL